MSCKDAPLTMSLITTLYEDDKSRKDIAFIWKRRSDLSGCKIKIAYINLPPYFHSIKQSGTLSSSYKRSECLHAGGKVMCGIQVPLFKFIIQHLNFSVNWIYVEDNKFGENRNIIIIQIIYFW